MNAAGLGMGFEVEVMRLQICEGVRHIAFAGSNLLMPDDCAAALDAGLSVNVVEVVADDQLRSEAAGPQLRPSKVEVVALLELVVGELVAGGHADAIGRPIIGDDIDPGDLCLFTTVFVVARALKALK